MHPSCYRWVGQTVSHLGLAALNTLEVGALNVNGSVKDFFCGPYLGIDMRDGLGVDVVMDGHDLHFDDGEFEVTISAETLEHADRPWRVMSEMARVTTPGGIVLVTARGFDQRGCFELHDHPADRWRLGPGAMEVLAGEAGLHVIECVADPECPGWFLAAEKRDDGADG